MKFSYELLKKLVSSIKNSTDLAELLTMGIFEVDEVLSNALEVKVLPNRYSDAASHWGLAREIAALAGAVFKAPKVGSVKTTSKKKIPVQIKTRVCRRMATRYFEGVKIGPSPKWMREALLACGFRPINNLVDITNYVTLETGQPLHVFDADKMEGGALIVRAARAGETVELLLGAKIKLDPSIVVLSDSKDALDIAGIKGGKKAEITKKTKNILLTAGNFLGASIYKASKKTGVVTDASLRFSHNLTPELVPLGMERAGELLSELCFGRAGTLTNVYPKKVMPMKIRFDPERIIGILGVDFKEAEIKKYLGLLGFVVMKGEVLVPPLRSDVVSIEDLAEEVGRLHGYDNISGKAPLIALILPVVSEELRLRRNLRSALLGFGFDEVYNSSFISGEDNDLMGDYIHEAGVEVKNPISEERTHLRRSLVPLLLRNIRDNLRFYEKANIFEIGKVFGGAVFENRRGDSEAGECLMLGLARFNKNKGEDFFKNIKKLKEAINGLIWFLGESKVFYNIEAECKPPFMYCEKIEIGGKVIGQIWGVELERNNTAGVAEIYFDALVKVADFGRHFVPLPKYPEIARDISFFAGGAALGEVVEAIKKKNIALIRAVDRIGEDWKKGAERGVVMRIIFRADDRTLTKTEIDREMEGVKEMLRGEFGAETR